MSKGSGGDLHSHLVLVYQWPSCHFLCRQPRSIPTGGSIPGVSRAEMCFFWLKKPVIFPHGNKNRIVVEWGFISAAKKKVMGATVYF